ncbi:MAG TPA: OsmC family protein [Parasegetibacter sp.]
MVKIDIKRTKGDFGFEASDANGHTIFMDASPEIGGGDSGARPMQVLLMGLGGCSGIDIVNILKKQRQDLQDIAMTIEAERETGKEPALWMKANIVFHLNGNLDPSKAQKAADLSMEKYCSVAETLRRAGCEITWEVRINQK